MAVEIGALRALLSLDSAAFENGAKRAQASMGNLRRRMHRTAQFVAVAAKRIAGGLALIGAAAGAGAVSAARSLSELSNRARLAGLSAQEFKVVSLAVREFGIEEEKLADILKDVNDKFGDFIATGKGPLADFFENIAPKVGVTKEAFEGLSSSDALALYVRSLEEANVSQQEMTFYMEALASDATALIPVFSDNARVLNEMRQRADELGLSLSGKTIEAASKARAEFSIVGEVLKTQFQAALVEILPSITRLAEAAIPAMVAAIEAVKPIIEALARLFEGDFSGALNIAADVVRNIGSTIADGLSSAANLALNAVDGIVSDILAKVRALPGQLIEAGRAAVQGFVNGLLQKWEELKASVIAAFDLSSIFGGGISNEASGGTGAARKAGANVAEGLAAGVMSGAGAGRRAGASAMQSVIDAAEETGKIESPSRVFMRIGRDLMAGLGIGVQQNVAFAADAVSVGVASMSESLDGLGDKSDQVADRFASMVGGIINGSQSIGDVLSQIGGNLLQSGLSGLFKASGIGGLFAGAFDGGGIIPAGKFGLAGERRAEIVTGPRLVPGPARVLGGAATARMMSGGAEAMNVTITMDESTGSIGAFVRDQAGRVVAQAAPKIVSQSVGATYKRAREVPIGRR